DPRPGLHQLIDRAAERTRVAEQRGDVAEHDPGLGIVRNGADRVLEIVLELVADHERLASKRVCRLVSRSAPLWRTLGRRATRDGRCRSQPGLRRRSCRASGAGPRAGPARWGWTIAAASPVSATRRMRSAAWRA